MKKILPALIVGALAVTLVVPSFAETATSNEITKGRGGYEFHQKAVKARGVNQEQLMELVQKYAPELQEDFQAIENNIKNTRKIPQLDEATKEKLIEIRDKVKAGTLTQEQAKEEMEELGLKGPGLRVPMDKGPRMELDEATKEKLVEIREKVKAGTLTQEQAREEMEELGLKAPGLRAPMNKGPRMELDEATKEKLVEIRDKVKAGTLTQEQAREEMEELGMKGPGLRVPMDKGPRMELDEATKEKLVEIREKVKAGTLTQEQAKEELEELGMKGPGLRVPMDKGPRMELDEATKEKLIEIRDKVQAGTLTQEQAKEELEALGINAPMLKMGERNKFNDSLQSKLQQAVEANDEAQIKDLLNELLIKLQNKTNQ